MTKRMIDTGIWSDPYIVDNFSTDDKLFWVYLLTNMHNSICGTCCIASKTISDEIGFSKDVVNVLIERFVVKYKYIFYDNQTNEILIKKWFKYNWTNSLLLKTNIEKAVKTVKNPAHIAFLNDLISKINWGEKDSNINQILMDIDTVSIGYRYPSISNTIPDIINIKRKRGTGERKKEFIPPTFEEVLEYAKKRNRSELAKKFYEYFTADENRLWIDKNGNLVQSWKQKFITWESYGTKKADKPSSGALDQMKRICEKFDGEENGTD